MISKYKNSPYLDNRFKDKEFITKQIIQNVQNGTGFSINSLKHRYSEEMFFLVALKYVITTKKALCKALDINIDNACRYKRDAEVKGNLVQSIDVFFCPFTGYKAHLISTNKDEFNALLKSNTNQTKLSL